MEITASAERKLADQLVDWYWSHGKTRKGLFEPSPLWLDALYGIRDSLAAIDEQEAGAKGTIGIWGPSKAGKSALISWYIDSRESPDSALSWSADSPIRFSRSTKYSDIVTLNPYNLGSDASGCVSRFVIRNDRDIPELDFPVEIKFARRAQILHSIAAGYITECVAKNAEGETVALTLGSLQNRLDKLPETEDTNARDGLEEVYEFVNVLEALVKAEFPRYSNLDANGVWSSTIRKTLLSKKILQSDGHQRSKFIADTLWDGKEALGQLYDGLCKAREKFSNLWGRRTIRCSLEAAALLLDIDSYKALEEASESSSAELIRIKSLAKELGWKIKDESVLIGRGLENALVTNNDNFGELQALVAELTIPLRRAYLESNAPDLKRVLEQADIVDFPGVPGKQQGATSTQINLDEPKIPQYKLLAEVFKRGKTVSIISDYARKMCLDSFLILAQCKEFPAKPKLLLSAVRQWWSAIDPKFMSNEKAGRRPPRPLNLGITFMGRIINDVAESGIGKGLGPMADMLGTLGIIADPNISTTFALTYPWFQDGGKVTVSGIDLTRAIDNIKQDSRFAAQFTAGQSRSSFDIMARSSDGGVSYLFAALGEQLSSYDRPAELGRKREEFFEELMSLLDEVAPQLSNEAERQSKMAKTFSNRLLVLLMEQHQGRAKKEVVAQVSFELRKFFDVDAETLDPIPLLAANNPHELSLYIEHQFGIWAQNKKHHPYNKGNLLDTDELARLAHLLAGFTDKVRIAEWLREEFGHLEREGEARICRRYLAIAMSNALLHGDSGPGEHTDFSGDESGVICKLDKFGEAEYDLEDDWQSSPHYISVILPVVKRLSNVLPKISSERPNQPGDREASSLVKQAQDLRKTKTTPTTDSNLPPSQHAN